jgi:hypothetical protein
MHILTNYEIDFKEIKKRSEKERYEKEYDVFILLLE